MLLYGGWRWWGAVDRAHRAQLDRALDASATVTGGASGASDADSARSLSTCADAIVIGSKLIETMEAAVSEAQQNQADPDAADASAIQAASAWLGTIRQALS